MSMEDSDEMETIPPAESDIPAVAKAARKLSRGIVDAFPAAQWMGRSSPESEASDSRMGSKDVSRQVSFTEEESSEPLMGRTDTERSMGPSMSTRSQPRPFRQGRRGSMQIMSDLLAKGASRIGADSYSKGGLALPGGTRKRKHSLSVWQNFTTVAFNQDEKMDFEDYFSQARDESFLDALLLEAPTWIVPGIVGAATACSGYLIEKMVDWLGDMRLGICLGTWNSWWFGSKESCRTNWYAYSEDSPVSFDTYGWFQYVWISTLLATTGAAMTWAFAPMARGSGIPEIKTVLGGFVMREVLELNTLIVKIFGLAVSVAAGLSCGKEGPLVHIACCFSNLICKIFPRFARNESKQRECLSCACAAGVAIAFGAPLGGVLFSLEEASTYFPTRTMIRAFFSGSAAATVMQFLKTDRHGTKPLTMFQADYSAPPHIIEYSFFAVLGVLGGCIGALFVHYNIMVSKNRAPGTPFRRRCHVVFEVLLIALVTAITSYPVKFSRVISNQTIRALFLNCYNMHIPEGMDASDYHLGVCAEDGHGGHVPAGLSDLGIVPLLVIAGLLRYVQMIFTFGTGTPSGLFIPSLYTGAVLGRVVGILAIHLNNVMHFREDSSEIYPGIYSMMGAAAVLGGVCRVTISLVVIMFELTGGIQLIVPFMIVCLLAKGIGDLFTPGIYDYYIHVRRYPFLHEPDNTQYHITAKDMMDTQIDVIHPQEQTVKNFEQFLRMYSKHSGYPFTQSRDDPTLLGYIHAKPLRENIEFYKDLGNLVTDDTKVGFWDFTEETRPNMGLDLSRFVDRSVHRIVEETPAADVHNMFRMLGIKIVLVVGKKGNLVGIITKKSYINFMSTEESREVVEFAKSNTKEKLRSFASKYKRGPTLL